VCHSNKCNASDASLSAEQIQAITAGIDFLYSGLREANRRFQISEDSGRDGAVHALEIIIKFLGRYEPVRTEALYAPLIGLFDALMNLEDGRVQPILQKVRRKGRGRASAGRESFKGAVAATVHRLSETGVPLAEAYELVARFLDKEGVSAERGKFPKIRARTIRGWYADVAADVGRHGEASKMYDLLQTKFSGADGAELSERDLFERLATLIRATRQGQKPVKPPLRRIQTTSSSALHIARGSNATGSP
jgi:hypothetical protein